MIGLSLVMLFALASSCTGAQGGRREGLEKVSPDLVALFDAYTSASRSGTMVIPQNPLLQIVDDRVVVDAVASGSTSVLQADLEALGMREAVAAGRIVSGQLPIAAIAATAALMSLQFIRPAYSITQTNPPSPPR